jgi:hypothetical protein
MTQDRISYVIAKLKLFGHTDNLFIGIQIGLLMADYRGGDLHDDTCAIITSAEYLAM